MRQPLNRLFTMITASSMAAGLDNDPDAGRIGCRSGVTRTGTPRIRNTVVLWLYSRFLAAHRQFGRGVWLSDHRRVSLRVELRELSGRRAFCRARDC